MGSWSFFQFTGNKITVNIFVRLEATHVELDAVGHKVWVGSALLNISTLLSPENDV